MNKDASRSHGFSERLVRHAAGSAPAHLRERLEEEWLADLQARHGRLSRLRFAVGCGWASRVIAVEHPKLALANAGHGRVPMGAPPPGGFTRRTSSLVVVLGLHAGIFYAAWSNLSQTQKSPPVPPLNIKDIPAPAREPFRPDDAVDLTQIRLTNIHEPTEFPFEKLPPVTWGDSPPEGDLGRPLDPPIEPVQHVAVRVTGAPAAGFPNVDDFYPATSIRTNEQGTVAVRVCVNQHGRLDGDASVLQSSGSVNLDAAALKVARAGSGHYRPTTEDGRAVASCFAYALRFQIRNVR